jgi:hypothetical protein
LRTIDCLLLSSYLQFLESRYATRLDVLLLVERLGLVDATWDSTHDRPAFDFVSYSFPKNLENFLDSPLQRIFKRMNNALNIDKKIIYFICNFTRRIF